MNAVIGNREMVDLLRRLIQAGSENPPGDVNRCVAVVAELLEREEIPFRLMKSKPGVRNIWARLSGSKGKTEKGKTFLFNGHLDTLPAGNGWSLDPFAAEIKGNYMYGRGATDMKAGLASSLMAFVGLKRRVCQSLLYRRRKTIENGNFTKPERSRRNMQKISYNICRLFFQPVGNYRFFTKGGHFDI